MQPHGSSAAPSTSRERSRSRSRSRCENRCVRSKIRASRAKQKTSKKQVRVKANVKCESDDDKSIAGSSDTSGDKYDEVTDEEYEDDYEREKCPPVRRTKRVPRKRAQTPDENDSLAGTSIATYSDDSEDQDVISYTSDTSSTTETTSKPKCSKKTPPRRKPILKKCPAMRGRQRSRSRSGRSRLIRSHIHKIDDHDRGSKCRLCTTCAARYQQILMNGRYA